MWKDISYDLFDKNDYVNIFPLDRSEEENIPFDRCVMVYPESLAIACLYSFYLTQTNQLVSDNDDEHKVKSTCNILAYDV